MKRHLSDQVRSLLRLVASNVDLVCEGVEGPVLAGDAKRNTRIEALANAGVLRVEDESTFRLNPRLKAFVEDRLGAFQAFRSLTRIDSNIRHAERLWREVQALHRDDEDSDAQRLEIELGEVFSEIAYDIERNLLVLNSNLSTEYGNVDSLKAKLRQNKFFLAEVKSLSSSVEKLGATADRIADECLGTGIVGVTESMRRNITSRLLGWVQQINEAQHTISRRLFQARLLAERLSRLSRIALWLRQRSALAADREFDIDDKFDALLLRPKAVAIVPHVDVRDGEPLVQEALIGVVSALPTQTDNRQKSDVKGAQPPSYVREDDVELADEAMAPHEQALLKLVDVALASQAPISLLEWKSGESLLDHLFEEEWLLYASTQVEAEGLRLEFMFAPAKSDQLNERFYDAMVSR